MSQKFIDWENLAYVLEQLRKETIDHASLDEHLDAMWETREKVTNKMKYAYEDYTETDYNTPETTPHKSIVGINRHNLAQDGRLSAVEAKNEAQDDKLDDHDTTLGSHTSTLATYGGKLDDHDTTLGKHAKTLDTYGGKLDDHDTTLGKHAKTLDTYGGRLDGHDETLGSHTSTLATYGGRLDGHDETLESYGERITSIEELLAELTATNLRPLATEADTEGMLNKIFGDNSNDSNS